MAEGAIKKVGDFLGVSKFGQGIASATRVLTGEVGQDIARQNQMTSQVDKILYALKQEKDPEKRRQLFTLGQSLGGQSAESIDPGLNLSNREILGSAASVGLNILTPGAFRGGAGAVIGKNALLGGAFGAASGLEKGRSAGGVVGSTIGGAAVGAALGTGIVAARWLKDFATKSTPRWLMNKAVRPTLDELRKNIKHGSETLGEELLNEGVAGGPKRLLEIAETKLTQFEDELQRTLSAPELQGVQITRQQLRPYLGDLISAKSGVPGLGGDVQRIKGIVDSVPETMSLQDANIMKRRIYNELRDVAYKLDPKLSAKAQTLKIIARGLKEEIEKAVGGVVVRDINRKLSIYGRLENRIVDQMARSMRNNAFSLTDAILTAGGAALSPTGLLAGLAAAGSRHVLGSTGARTYIAQGLNKLKDVGTGAVGSAVGEVTRRGVLNAP